jgi:hypothetical protein
LATFLDCQGGNLDGDLAGQVVTKRAQRLAVVEFLIGLFAALPLNGVRDPLCGGASPKRVAARSRLAEELGFGSVSLRFFWCRRFHARRGRFQQFSRQRFWLAMMMRCSGAGS